MKKKNEYLKSIIVLGSICLVIAMALASVNYITAPIIAEHAADAEKASLGAVLEGAGEFEKLELPVNSPETVTAVYKDKGGAGYAVALSTTSSYSQSPLTFTLGVSADGKICGVEITNYAETKDFGSDYPKSYIGADSTLSEIDLVSGVTYSSTAFKDAVSDALRILISMGEIHAGEISSRQLTLDMLPDILPGALDNAGNPKVIELPASDSYNFGFKAVNGSGYVFCIGDEGVERLLSLSATGGIAAHGLHGEQEMVFTEDEYSALLAEAQFNDERANSAAAGIMGDEKFDKITLNDQFGTVIGAYTTEGGKYLFICAPFGYKEPLVLAYLIDGDGKISLMRNISEFIQDSEYYTYYTLDESGYRMGFRGLDKDSLTDDVTLITGATETSKAVATAARDAFAAFDSIKEVKR